MNFHGYQQSEFLTQQVMHMKTIQEGKIDRKMSVCLLSFSRPFLKPI